MDYSAAVGEASPWGSSSPRVDRDGFAARPQPPDSPTAAAGHARADVQDVLPESVMGPRATTTAQDSENASHGTTGGGQHYEDGSPSQDTYRDGHDARAAAASPSLQQAPGQQPRQAAARYHNRPPQPKAVPQYKLQAKVTALERTGRKDPVLRFDVYTNLPRFRTTQFRDVRRTHSEFVKLADHLISSNPEAMVPAVPPALTSAGAGTEEDEVRVKGSIQRWLNHVCSNDVLIRDDEMVFFVESDFGYSPVQRMKQPATGVRRKVLKQFAPPPDDTPELHVARPVVKAFYLATIDSAQKMDKLVKSRRGLGLAESSLGEKLSQLHVQETHPGLANAYRKMGRIIQSVGDYHAAQGTAEATTFGDPLNYHSADAFIVKETLTNRHILLRELLQAEQARRSKEGAVIRMKSSTNVKPDKVDEAISASEEATAIEEDLREKTRRVTANLLLDKRRWFDRTSDDMLASIREYVLRQIESERRLLSTLESVRSDVRAIDASGGLSRLGRESHPSTARKVSIASSQGAKGDSWSGVARSREAMSRSVSGGVTPSIPEADESTTNGDATAGGRPRSGTGNDSVTSGKDDEDDDRVDARNAASRLAQSTF